MEVNSGEGRPDNSKGYLVSSGDRVPSVSEILDLYKDKSGLVRWAHRLGLEGLDMEEEKRKAADAGSLCHDMIDCRIWGTQWEEPPRPDDLDPVAWDMRLDAARNGFSAFEEWFRDFGVKILGTESPMVSEQFRFGGTPDAWGELGGRLVLLDWKTSNSLHREYVMQLAAYRWLLKECKGIEVERIHLLRFSKQSADFEHRSYGAPVIKAGWNSFVGRLRCYQYDRELAALGVK